MMAKVAEDGADGDGDATELVVASAPANVEASLGVTEEAGFEAGAISAQLRHL
jgi:hypothetical protein